MSKKSRKRNKKILGALAAGLGAVALAKRGVPAAAANVDSGRGGDSSSAKARAANIVRAQFPFKNTDPILHGGLGVKLGRNKWRGDQSMDPNRNIFQNLKKGGSVTGAAKRGFGRALMKGKK